MKKKYFEPDAEWIYYSNTDVIRTSDTEKEAEEVEMDSDDDSPW